MYDKFLEIYAAFENSGLDDPLVETLRYFDVLSEGAFEEVIGCVPENTDIKSDIVATKRKDKIPLEHILGKASFCGEMFYCSPATLIPRKETELLVNVGLSLIKELQKKHDNLSIVDMGTGCGNIAITLALNTENTSFQAIDLEIGAVEIAKKNAKKFGLNDRVKVLQGNLFEPIMNQGYEGKIDLVVCNPPYIPTASLKKLPKEVIENEPKAAFDAGPFGIDFYRRLFKESLLYLKPKGLLVFEIGAGQDKLVTRLFKMIEGYRSIKYYKDGDVVRVISAAKEKKI